MCVQWVFAGKVTINFVIRCVTAMFLFGGVGFVKLGNRELSSAERVDVRDAWSRPLCVTYFVAVHSSYRSSAVRQLSNMYSSFMMVGFRSLTSGKGHWLIREKEHLSDRRRDFERCGVMKRDWTSATVQPVVVCGLGQQKIRKVLKCYIFLKNCGHQKL